MLECSATDKSQNIVTTFNIKSKYVNGKFSEINNDVVVDLSSNWILRNDYKYSLEQDSEIYKDAGFTYDVVIDSENKYVVAKMYGNRDTLNEDIIYMSSIDSVRKHMEESGYICKEETLK